MNLQRLSLSTCFLLLAGLVLGQQSSRKDDIDVSVKTCRIIQMTLEVRERHSSQQSTDENDDFAAAGHRCTQLTDAISASDPAKIQAAAADLRPILARLGRPPASPQEQLAALEASASALTGEKLFYKLPELAKRAFNAGAIDKATAYSKQVLEMAPQYPKDWNYGNAIYYGNFVLGRVAVQDGNLKQAGQYLLAAGATPGSPQLNSFGPNMTLAKDLLEKGQSEVVLQYLTLCRNFWKMDYGKLDQWSAAVRSGGTPNFASNLMY